MRTLIRLRCRLLGHRFGPPQMPVFNRDPAPLKLRPSSWCEACETPIFARSKEQCEEWIEDLNRGLLPRSRAFWWPVAAVTSLGLWLAIWAGFHVFLRWVAP